MSPIFKCLICRKDIERSTKSFWNKKGHLLCSTCLDQMDKPLEKEQSKTFKFLKNNFKKYVLRKLLDQSEKGLKLYVNKTKCQVYLQDFYNTKD